MIHFFLFTLKGEPGEPGPKGVVGPLGPRGEPVSEKSQSCTSHTKYISCNKNANNRQHYYVKHSQINQIIINITSVLKHMAHCSFIRLIYCASSV